MSAGALPIRSGHARAAVAVAQFFAQFLARAALGTLSAMIFWSVAPNLAGWSSEVIVSGSMMPRVAPGDVVVTAPVDPATLVPGQVILVANPARPGTLLMHRMIAWNPDGTIKTRGDANRDADSTPVPRSMVRGLPRLRIPSIGLPMLWIRHGEYRMVVIAALGLLTAIAVSTSRTNDDESEDDGAKAESNATDPAEVAQAEEVLAPDDVGRLRALETV
jgi:signal peptidase